MDKVTLYHLKNQLDSMITDVILELKETEPNKSEFLTDLLCNLGRAHWIADNSFALATLTDEEYLTWRNLNPDPQ